MLKKRDILDKTEKNDIFVVKIVQCVFIAVTEFAPEIEILTFASIITGSKKL